MGRFSGFALHELKLVPAADAEDVAVPKFVRQALHRWENFAGAVTASPDLRVARLLEGSLRIVFASSAESHDRLVNKFARLLQSENASELTIETAGLAGPYYDLLQFMSAHQCALEVFTSSTAPTRQHLMMSIDRATEHLELIDVPEEVTGNRRIIAKVVSASITRGTLELEFNNERIDTHVAATSRPKLRGLRIASEYFFDLSWTARKEHPSSQTRIEIEILSAHHGLSSEASTNPAREVPKASKRVPPRRWFKRLATTDAMRSASGHTRPYVPLTKSGHDIDHRSWFRHDLFGELEWEPSGVPKYGDVTYAEMTVSVFGVSMGIDTVMLSHLPSRAEHHNAPTTYLHWSTGLRKILAENDLTKVFLVVERDKQGRLHLHFERDAPT